MTHDIASRQIPEIDALLTEIPDVIKVTTKLTTMQNLYQYYKPVEVEGYCSACPNYGRIWSCPPFDFDVQTYLEPFNHILIIGVKTKDFEGTRQLFGDILTQLETEETRLEVLIAGNCNHCEVCSKVNDAPCIMKDGTKYSLESLGYHVSDICEHLLESPLDWSGNEGTFMTVGAILSNSKEALEGLL